MNVLYVQPGPGVGGSNISLIDMLKCAPKTQRSFLALSAPDQSEYEALVKSLVEKVFYLDIPTWRKYRRRTWQEKLRGPFGNGVRLLKLIPATQQFMHIIQSEQIDIVHTNNSISAVGGIAAWRAKKPHVWHVREAFGTKRQFHPFLGDPITYWLMKKLSNIIICNSMYTAEPFKDREISHVIIQNGIDLQKFILEVGRGKDLRSKIGITDREIVIGMVGNLATELKKHDIFLELAGVLNKEFNYLKFIIFGGSTNLDQTIYTRKLAKQTTEFGISDSVIWADFVSDSAVIMNSLDILVHPAITEGSGRVVMEAMAAGKPVVAMNSGGVKELILDGQTGFLVEVGDLGRMVERVKTLIGDNSLRIRIGENARSYACKHFSDQASMDAIVKVYEELIQA